MKTATLIHLFLLAACVNGNFADTDHKPAGMRRAVEDATKQTYRMPKLPGFIVLQA